MPYALGAVAVSAGQKLTIPLGSAGTVGAVVIANESPFSVLASAGAGGQWIVAQTSDLVACNVAGFNGNLTIVTDNYLNNASEAPSFLLYLTVYAPGEAIRGTFPAPLMRLASGNLSVGTNAGVTLEQDLFTPFVLTGITPSGVGTNQYSTTGGIAFPRQPDGSLLRTAVGATSQGGLAILAPSTTYFHDLNPDGTFSFATSHSSQPNYLTIATVITDNTGIISTITDARVLSTLLFNSMANAPGAPGVQLYNLHVNKTLQCDNQVSVQGNFRTTSGTGGTSGWQIKAGADSELELTPDSGTGAEAIIFNIYATGFGPGTPPFAIGSASVPIALPLAYIDDSGVIHAPTPVQLISGKQETGFAGLRAVATANGQIFGVGVNYKTVMSNVPTSFNNTVVSANGFASFSFSNIDKYGFSLEGPVNQTGSVWVYIHYTTVGNCLLALDLAARTLDHHCDACGQVTRGAPIGQIEMTPGMTPSATSMCFRCPSCGAREHFNCGLTADDETDPAPQGSGQYATTRGAQATLIRQLMSALGLEVTS